MNMAIMPVRRNLSFKLSKDKINRWNGNGLHFTQFLNTLSLFFPAGERFFIDSVRNYRNKISDNELKTFPAEVLKLEHLQELVLIKHKPKGPMSSKKGFMQQQQLNAPVQADGDGCRPRNCMVEGRQDGA